MRKNIKKGILLGMILAVIAMSVQQPQLLQAEEVYTTDGGGVDFQQGNAEIKLQGKQDLSGKMFQIHQLFTAENAKNLESINYTMNPIYESAIKTVIAGEMEIETHQLKNHQIIYYMQNLGMPVTEGAITEQNLEHSQSEYRYFVEKLLEQIQKENLKGMKVQVTSTKSDNSVLLKNLSYGYYMVEDVTSNQGLHTAVSMTMLSTANPDTSIHLKADYPSLIKKIQEDDNREAVGTDGWNDVGDYEIGQKIPYQFQSTIPNINGYNSYYYAWHDNMHEALTLCKDSVQIQITGTHNSESKTYFLTENEFQIKTDAPDATFIVEVQDIKAIVDREFPNLNERQERDYGQQVILTYEAALNDKAALDLGRPGFENTARLEFSNNPNLGHELETGFTPWDTVVCFTYQVQGLKVNNYNTALEGAEFRLYSDRDCKHEVYVKQVANRFHVFNRDSCTEETLKETVTIQSDENGEFNICGLDSGVYYLKEIKAPSGYQAIEEPIEIRVISKFLSNRDDFIQGEHADVLELSGEAYMKLPYGDSYREETVDLDTDVEDGKIYISIVNEIGSRLPITGSYLMPILIVVGIIFLVLAVRKRKDKYA